MTSQSVISLAILKVNWDTDRRDYLENFVPIVSEAIRVSTENVVSASNLQANIRRLFGLQIPQNALRAILRRMAKRRYVKLERGIYNKNPQELAKLKFHEIQQQVLRMHESLISHLQRFAQDRFQLALSEQDAENAFQEYIQENQVAIGVFSEDKEPIVPEPESKIKGAKYIVGLFVQHLIESNSPDFEYLETIVKGNLIANAIFITEPGRTAKKFRNTEVYFDTSFLVFALGYAGQERQDPCRELLELLYKDGAKLRCFRHTLEEIRGVLDACANIIQQGRFQYAYGPSIEYFITNKFTASDIELFVTNLERDLKNIRVDIVEKPPYIPEYVIDEPALYKLLIDKIFYHNEIAPQRDVDSIAAIMRLRGGGEFFFIEECKAVFVTTNGLLVRLSKDFFYKEASANSIPPAFPDYLLTNLLWLKTPLAAPELPRKRIIADYYAATQPSTRSWKSYLDEINKLQENKNISTDDYYLLRYTLDARTALMDVTLGEDDVLSLATVNEILDLTKQYILKEREEELQAQIRAESEKREIAEQTASSALARELIRKARITNLSQQVSFTIVTAVKIIVIALLLIGSISTFPWSLPALTMRPFNYAISILQIILLILTVASFMYGFALDSYLKALEVLLSKKIYQFLASIFS